MKPTKYKNNKNKNNKKTRKGGGTRVSKPKHDSPKSEKKMKKTKKRVSFSEKNEIRNQSPRSDDAFYYSAKVDHSAKKKLTKKELSKKSFTRRKSIVAYQNRRVDEDLLDMALGRIPLYQ
jgi:hypothetical protein